MNVLYPGEHLVLLNFVEVFQVVLALSIEYLNRELPVEINKWLGIISKVFNYCYLYKDS